jgi:putative intracellular protease/amidase
LITLPFNAETNEFLFSGYKVNSVTKTEEWFIETFVMKGKPKVRKISTLLKDRGMIYESSFLPGRSYAVKDRNLITSQNPFSGQEFIDYYLESIKEYLEKF